MTLTAVEPKLTVAQFKVRAMKDALQYQFIERDEHVEAILCALVSRENVIGFGDPGTGKSDLVHAVCNLIIGAKYGWWLMDRQMDKAELLGMMDLKHYKDTSRYAREVTNTLYDAHVTFFDEADKCGPGVKTPLLTAINEHMGDFGYGWQELPGLTAFAACNAELESGDEAFGDRFLVKLRFERIRNEDAFLDLLDSLDVPRIPANQVTIELDELLHAINVEVPAVQIPRQVKLSMAALRRELEAEQIFPSDRRFKKSQKLVKAVAWLDGRTVAQEDDLRILMHCLWDVEEHRTKVAGIVLNHTGPVTRAAMRIMSAVAEAHAAIDKMLAADESLETMAASGARLQDDMKTLIKEVATARSDAGTTQSGLQRLDEVDEQLKELHVRIMVNCMGTPEAGARRLVGV